MGTLFGLKGGAIGAMVLVCLICLAIISRNWSCRKHRQPRPKPPVAYQVVEVESGASLLVARGRRQFEVSLWGVAAPTESQACFNEAKSHLQSLAGEWVRVEEKGSLHPAGKQVDCGLCLGTGQTEPPEIWVQSHPRDKGRKDVCPYCSGSGKLLEESRRHIVIIGIAYGQSGQCLQLEQLRAGYCRCLDGAPAEWRAAEKEARSRKAGQWQN